MRFLFYFLLLFSFTSLSAQDECAFDFHDFDANFKEQALANFVTKGVIPPFEHLEIPFEDFTFKPDRPKIFTLPSGTMIDIPKNAFTDESGKIVDEKVVLYYREFNTPTDILLSGIPMNYKTEEGDMPMQSAGMFEIRASTTTGEEVFPNPEQSISVSVLSTETEDDFNYYEMSDETGEWEEKGKDEMDVVPEFYGDWSNMNFNATMPLLESPLLNVKVLNGGNRVWGHNKLQFKASIFLTKRKKYKKENDESLSLKFSEMNAWNNLTWIYDGDKKDEKKIRRKLNDLSRKQQGYSYLHKRNKWDREDIVDSLQLSDIEIVINPEGDNYLFSFFWENEVFVIPVYPYLKTDNKKIEQKRNLKVFKEYLVRLEERKIQWERQKAFYESEKIMFTRNLQMLSEQRANGKEGNPVFFGGDNRNFRGNRIFLLRRAVRVLSLGLCNIDKVFSNPTNQEILVELEDKLGNTLKAKAFHIWDDTNKVLRSSFNNSIQVTRGSKENTVTILFEDNQTAIVSRDEFNEFMKARKGNKLKLIVEPKSSTSINRKQLSQITAAL